MVRGGGKELALMELLGHESFAMIRRYARLAAADVQADHQSASPAESFFRATSHRTAPSTGRRR